MNTRHFAPLFLVIALFAMTSPSEATAQTQPSVCESEATDMGKVLCYLRENSERLTALEESQAEILNFVSPAWSYDQTWCLDIAPIAASVDIGGAFGVDIAGVGEGGIYFYGSGAAAEGDLAVGLSGGIAYSPSVALSGTYCLTAPQLSLEGPTYPSFGKRGASLAGVSTPDLEDMLEQNLAVKGGLENVVGDLSLLVSGAANLPGNIMDMANNLKISDNPSDMIQDMKDMGSAITGLITLPESIKDKISDPTLALQAEMSVDQLCSIVRQLPDTATWAETRRLCTDGFPVPDPEAYVAEAVQSIDKINEIESRMTAFLPSVEDARNRGNQITIAAGQSEQALTKLDDILSANSSTVGVGVTVDKIWQRVDRFTGGSNQHASDRGLHLNQIWARVDRFTGHSNANAESRGSSIAKTWQRVNLFVPSNELATNRGNQIADINGDTNLLRERIEAFLPSVSKADERGKHITVALGEIDRHTPNINRIDDIEGVVNHVRSKLDDLCGDVDWCSPDRGEGDTDFPRNAKQIPGSSAEEIAGKLGINSDENIIDAIVPDDYFLDVAYPNPSQSSVKVNFGLPRAESVRVRLFDATGREVSTGLDRSLPAGRHSVDLDVSHLASGTYFYRVDAGAWVSSKSVTVSR